MNDIGYCEGQRGGTRLLQGCEVVSGGVGVQPEMRVVVAAALHWRCLSLRWSRRETKIHFTLITKWAKWLFWASELILNPKYEFFMNERNICFFVELGQMLFGAQPRLVVTGCWSCSRSQGLGGARPTPPAPNSYCCMYCGVLLSVPQWMWRLTRRLQGTNAPRIDWKLQRVIGRWLKFSWNWIGWTELSAVHDSAHRQISPKCFWNLKLSS